MEQSGFFPRWGRAQKEGVAILASRGDSVLLKPSSKSSWASSFGKSMLFFRQPKLTNHKDSQGLFVAITDVIIWVYRMFFLKYFCVNENAFGGMICI